MAKRSTWRSRFTVLGVFAAIFIVVVSLREESPVSLAPSAAAQAGKEPKPAATTGAAGWIDQAASTM